MGVSFVARYRKISELGSGGFGIVWKVKRIPDGQEFAAKYLDDGAAVSDDDKDRFRKEVRLLKTLDHPHIVKVIGSHVAEEPLWYVLPLYRGSLREIVSDLVADENWRHRVLDQVLAGMEHAHENGVLHRDLKPENILFDESGDVVISDFGLGRQVDSDSTRKTHTGQRMGTPFYRAPEQETNAKATTHLSDIYSLGRIIYELCTGDPPGAQQDLEKLNLGLRRIIGRCTRKDPAERYQSVSELRRDFNLVATGAASRRRGDSLVDILGRMLDGNPDDDDWENFEEAIREAESNPDTLHEALMRMPPVIYDEFERRYPDSARSVVESFCEHVSNSGWSFEYCDKIARVIEGLYLESGNANVRVKLIECLFLLGTSHNRFYVMGKFEDYLAKLSDPGEILAVRDMFLRFPRAARMHQGSLMKKRIPALIHDVLDELSA